MEIRHEGGVQLTAEAHALHERFEAFARASNDEVELCFLVHFSKVPKPSA
jgi:hypothetical protein